MRKHSIIACLAIAGMCAGAFAALPAKAKRAAKKAALAPEAPTASVQTQAVGPCGGPCTQFEDFDDKADFTAGSWIGNGLNGAAGGVFTTWSATCTSNPANWPGPVGTLTEGHVETAHPFSGSQHVRLSKDPNMITSLFSCVLDARVPATAVTVPGIVSPQTMSVQVAINGSFSANFSIQPQHPTNLMRTTTLLFFYYGTRYVVDNLFGATFTAAGTWDTSGAYEQYTLHIDPCAKYTCDGGANQSLACTSALDCPGGGICKGTIAYGDSGGVFYTGQAWAGQNFEQILFYSDNTGGGNPTGMDLDDLSADRSETPCPVVCGDDDITGDEDCEDRPELDGACPGLCVPAGGTGPEGEAECMCATGPCSTSNALANADNQSFGQAENNFGWWTFTAGAPAYGISACGTLDYDSALAVYEGTCDSLSLAPGNHAAGIAYNDDCYGGPGFGSGSDPLASCYNDPILVYAYPYNSCLCVPTNPGQQYWVFDPRVDFGDTTILNVEKRLSCDDNATGFGACCNAFGCTDVADQAECAANPDGGVYSDRKTCSGIACVPTLGACCERLAGECTETNETACSGNVIYSLGSHCDAVDCFIATGACCRTTPFEAECIDGVSSAGCSAEGSVWSKDELCSEVDCSIEIIPTVSEWGLVIMALLLLVGAKVYFGRREALA